MTVFMIAFGTKHFESLRQERKKRRFLYSITDFGVEAYAILPDGNLEIINFAPINGMRGCYLSTDYTNSFLFVAGYHDGKLTVLRIKEDGSIGEITDEVFHKGLGSIAERNSRPHINCARMTHDNKFLLVADPGMDHVKVYRLNQEWGKVELVDILHSELDSAPRHIKISLDGRFIYVVHEWSCCIDVYSYEVKNDLPMFEKIQTIRTVKFEKGSTNAASALSFSGEYGLNPMSSVKKGTSLFRARFVKRGETAGADCRKIFS